MPNPCLMLDAGEDRAGRQDLRRVLPSIFDGLPGEVPAAFDRQPILVIGDTMASFVE